jgi:hypothetical protein
MDMVRTAIKHAGDGQASGEDRFLVHGLATGEGMTLLVGTPIDDQTAARLTCDSSATQLLLGPDWEPLAMGAGPGRYLRVHHHQWWVPGGPTDVSNGYLAPPTTSGCTRAGPSPATPTGS